MAENEEKQEEVAAKETPAPVEKTEMTDAAAEAGSEHTENKDKKTDIFGDDEEAPKVKKIKGAKNITFGVVHVKATFNNTIVSVSDAQGNVISWSSAGKAGFKGSRKSTAYAASVVSGDAARAAMSHGLQEVEVRLQGPGAGRESAVRALQSLGLRVSTIIDVTPMPHNGCRPKKRRRV